MKTQQRTKLNMYLSVRNLISMNTDVIKKIPKFESANISFQDHINQIQEASELQSIDKKGLTLDKNKLRKKLTALTVKYSNRLTILAKSLNNDTLLMEVKASQSRLDQLSGVALLDRSRVIYDRIESNMNNLGDQAINQDTQKEFMTLITDFNNALSSPRTGIANRSKTTQRLSALFIAANDTLETLDLAVGSVKDEQPDFFNAYKSARKLVEAKNGKLSLRAQAIDIISKQPIKGAMFSFRHKNGSNGTREMIKKTAEKGSFQIKNMEEGKYDISVKKPGYKDKDLSVEISNTVLNDVKIELEKV